MTLEIKQNMYYELSKINYQKKLRQYHRKD